MAQTTGRVAGFEIIVDEQELKKDDPKATIVIIKGTLDLGDGGVDQLQAISNELIEQGVTRILLDLSETTYVVSRGFGHLLSVLARLRTREGDLRIAGAKGSVWVAASTVGLDNIIRFFPTVEEAVQSFADEV